MSFREELETRLEILKEFIQNWNIIEDLKGLLCINCIASIQKDIEQFRKNGTVDTEIDPNDGNYIKEFVSGGPKVCFFVHLAIISYKRF